jgi:hypothetical protein
MAKSSTEKYKLSMAGEYGFCAELCKRGYDASITFGNMKATDIIILMPDKTYRRIEVKTSRETRFVTGFFQKYFDKSRIHPDFWVLVQIDEENNSHYYILTHEEMGEVQMKRNEMDKWEKIDGCDNVLLRDLDPFKEQWDKFESIKENT